MSKKYLVAAVLCGCGVDQADPTNPEDATHPKAPSALLQAFADASPHSFIVSLPETSARTDRMTRIGRLTDITVEADWDQLPLAQVRANSLDAALAMLDTDDVEQAFPISLYELTDAQSFPLINQPAAAAAGNTGAGTSVAVLDTGTNYTLADFGSCTAPNTPASCRVAYAADFAPNDNSLDANGHGTNVAAIVAGVAPGTKILALDVFNGDSASSTDILSALNWVIANRATYNIASLNLSLGGGSSTSLCSGDAVGNALASAKSAGIAPVVASGNSATTNAISWPACAPAAVSVGAVYDANVGGLQYGNCTDAATAADKITCFSNSASFLTLLAPGALITAGGSTMAGTSQATPHVAGAFAVLHAEFPSYTVDQELGRLTSTGKKITDARNNVTTPRIDLGAATAKADSTPPTNGTATATPASGSIALAWSGFADNTGVTSYRVSVATGATAPANCATAIYTGSATSYQHTGLTNGTAYSYRVCALDAAGNSSTGATVTGTPHEMDAPTGGSIKINAGATLAKALGVSLTLSATDASGVTQMCISDGTTCSSWVTYATSASYTFGGDGSKTLRAWFRDKWGNTSTPASATILVDVTAPKNPTLTATKTSTTLALTWTAATDTGSGVASYKLVGASGSTAPASCSAGTALYSGTGRSFTHTVGTKATWSYRVCATDAAGNTSAGSTLSATTSN
ncbi:MAG: S8 family serine peptidase [Kofleriaceae bacterium]